jgi:alpha-beta hydrolase superfamily lysophospholipase
MPNVRRAGLAAALAAAPLALAWRFALVYRHRAGFPRPRPPRATPAILGLPYEDVTVDAPGTTLPAWFIPARDGAPGPGIVVVHGWESSRSRTLPMAHFLHGAGFHVLTVDVRGHGANPAEELPISAGEFGTDAAAGFDALLARPEVTVGAISGHSMGGIGAILAASVDDRVAAVVMTSSPAGPYRLTRLTFQLARLPIPDVIAYPLAWWTTRVFLRPRGHAVTDVSAGAAIARYAGPIFLAHGDTDDIVPLSHFRRLERIVRSARVGRRVATPVETMVVEGGRHSWLYEFPAYRGRVARFLARALGGPYEPDDAAARAVAVPAVRIPEPEDPISALEHEPGGFRSLAGIVGRPDPAGRRPDDGAVAALEA